MTRTRNSGPKAAADAGVIAQRLQRYATDERFRIENLFKIKLYQKRDIVPLRFNEAQVRLYQAYRYFRDRRMPVRLIICKARRAGLSTGVEALMFDDTIHNQNTNSLIVANQLSPSENVLSMCVRFWRYMPKYVRYSYKNEIGQLVEEVVKIRPDLDPKYNNKPPSDKLEFASPIDSKLFIASSKSVDQYLSFDFSNIHATEASRYDNAGELFRALSPTLSDDHHSAQYIESTPNGQSGKGEWFYEQVMDAALKGKTEYGETKLVFVPWHEMTHSFSLPFDDQSERDKFSKTLKSDEKDLMLRFPHISLEQIKWYRMKLASPGFNMDRDIWDQEYPSDLATAFIASGTNVFTKDAIRRLMSRKREPMWSGDVYWGESDRSNERDSIYNTIRRPHFYTRADAEANGFSSHVTAKTYSNLKVWRWPVRGERIVMGADIGRGNPLTKDGDYSTICVCALNELGQDELLMTWRGKLNPILFGEVCAALAWGIRYRVGDAAPKPLLAPEWTGPGSATCTYIDQKKLYEVDAYRMPGVKGMPKTKHIGWESNSKTKPYAVNWMVRMIEKDLIDVPSEELVLEMSSYRQKDNFGDEGSYGGAGVHDDLVSSFQIACAILRLETSTTVGDAPIREIDMEEIEQYDSEEPFDLLGPQAEEEEDFGYSGDGFEDDEMAGHEAELFASGW